VQASKHVYRENQAMITFVEQIHVGALHMEVLNLVVHAAQ